MTPAIPPALRAAAGLAALTLDEARRLPEKLVSLPVVAVGAAMQASLKVQQQYAGLVARGDELLTALRGGDEPPTWAQFDEEQGEGDATDTQTAADSPLEEAALDEAALDDATALEEAAIAEAVLDEAALDAAALDAAALDVAALDAAVLEATALEEELGTEIEAQQADELRAAVLDPALDAPAVEVIGIAPVPDYEAAPVPGYEAASVPDYEAAPVPDYEAAPVPGYDTWTIGQLRVRMGRLSTDELRQLLGYEQASRQRPPYLTMLENRLAGPRSR